MPRMGQPSAWSKTILVLLRACYELKRVYVHDVIGCGYVYHPSAQILSE